MLELGIPFLDLWEAYYFSGDHVEGGDGRHYDNEIKKLMKSLFYCGKSTEHYLEPVSSVDDRVCGYH
jgi:hypothetical protein